MPSVPNELKTLNEFSVNYITIGDIPYLIAIASHWVRDAGGITQQQKLKAIEEHLLSAISNPDKYKYLILRDSEDKPRGMLGMRAPEEKLLKALNTRNITLSTPIEIINVYLDPTIRGAGQGKRLMTEAFAVAQSLGYATAIWSSGLSFQETAWAFYDKLVGGHLENDIPDFFAPDRPARVWIKNL